MFSFKEILIFEWLGKDATESFEDIGHSDEAREILEKYLIGTLDEAVSDIFKWIKRY